MEKEYSSKRSLICCMKLTATPSTYALTEENYQTMNDKETAKEVWEELKRNFEASSNDQLFRFCADFFSFTWVFSDDVSSHVARLRTLWNEFNQGLQRKG